MACEECRAWIDAGESIKEDLDEARQALDTETRMREALEADREEWRALAVRDESTIAQLRDEVSALRRRAEAAEASVEAAHNSIDTLLAGIEAEGTTAALAVRGALLEVRAAIEMSGERSGMLTPAGQAAAEYSVTVNADDLTKAAESLRESFERLVGLAKSGAAS